MLLGLALSLMLGASLVACGNSTSSQTSTPDASSDSATDSPSATDGSVDSYVSGDTSAPPPDGQADTGGQPDPRCTGAMCGAPCSGIGVHCAISSPYCQQGTQGSVTCEPKDGGVDAAADAGGGEPGVWGSCTACGV